MNNENYTTFIKGRVIELKIAEKKLVKRMETNYTNSHRYELLRLKEQITFNQSLILDMDEGEEEYQLEN